LSSPKDIIGPNGENRRTDRQAEQMCCTVHVMAFSIRERDALGCFM
jgi:hypothetical protein